MATYRSDGGIEFQAGKYEVKVLPNPNIRKKIDQHIFANRKYLKISPIINTVDISEDIKDQKAAEGIIERTIKDHLALHIFFGPIEENSNRYNSVSSTLNNVNGTVITYWINTIYPGPKFK